MYSGFDTKKKKKSKKKVSKKKKAVKRILGGLPSVTFLEPKKSKEDTENNEYELKKYRLREELKFEIMRTINQFSSKEQLKDPDIVNVLASLIQRHSR